MTAPPARAAGQAGVAAKIEVRQLSHRYRSEDGQEVHALDNVSFEVPGGEVLTVVGPSGCGKSTLVSLIAGLAKPVSGDIRVGGRPVRKPGPDRGVVFQEFAILPWRTVQANVGHGLEIARVPKRERQRLVGQFIRLVGLEGFENRFPHELSGGMKQRVAVARTLAADPAVMLMDEPFAAVDAQTRITLQEELLRISNITRKTILFVTHNVEEAVFLGDRVMVMTRSPGRVKSLVQVPIPRTERTWDWLSGNSGFLGIREQVTKLVRAEVGEGRGKGGDR